MKKMIFLLVGLISLPSLAAPAFSKTLAVADRFACWLNDGKVECTRGREDANPPPMTNPIEIAGGGATMCAIHDGGIDCWGGKIRNPPMLKRPFSLTVGRNTACVISEGKVVCWGEEADRFNQVPPLKNPRQVSMSQKNACALDDKGVKCWAYYKGSTGEVIPQVPRLRNPKKISVGPDLSCAIDEKRVRCWGEWRRLVDDTSLSHGLSRLNNPQDISVGSQSLCVVDGGSYCWARGVDQISMDDGFQAVAGSHNIYCMVGLSEGVRCQYAAYRWEMNPWLSGFKTGPHLTQRICDASSPVRAAFLAPLLALESTEFIDPSSRYQDAHASFYFLVSFMGAAVRDSESPIFVNELIPAYEAFLRRNEKLLDSGEQSLGFMATPDTKLHRKIALTVILSALGVGESFLRLDQKKSWINAKKKASEVLTGQDDASKIHSLLQDIDALTFEKELLRRGAKTSFLPESLDLVGRWLKEKVK